MGNVSIHWRIQFKIYRWYIDPGSDLWTFIQPEKFWNEWVVVDQPAFNMTEIVNGRIRPGSNFNYLTESIKRFKE
jgi:hypothetical protein